jgi:hypothetical protein
VDYTVMVVTKEILKDAKSLASFFGLLFGSAKVIELLLKTTVSNRLLKHYGVQSGLITCSLVVGITTVFGLISHALGALSLLFIAALVNKVMERSLVRSVNAPAINILFQVYTGKLKGIAQNYGDGFGKTYGQLVSGILLFLLSMFHAFNIKVACLNTLILTCSGVLFYLSYRLVPLYKDALQERIALMVMGNVIPTIQVKTAESDRVGGGYTGGTRKTGGLVSNTIIAPAQNNISGGVSIEHFTTATSRALALHPQKEKITSLGAQMDGWSKQVWLGITPGVLVYWLMIPAFYRRIRKQLSGYPFETLEMLVKESDSFFRTHRYARPEAHMAMVALRALLFEKLTEANALKYSTQLLSEDPEMISTLLPIMGQSGHRLMAKDIHYYNLLQRCLDTYCQLLSILNTVHQQDCPLLQASIRRDTETRMGHIFHVLALVHDREIIDNIRSLMASQDSDDQVIAIEILELILDNQEKAWLMPIYQETSRMAVLKKLDRFFPSAIRTFPDTLEFLCSLSPAKMDLISRYLAFHQLVLTGTLRYPQAVAACFSREPLMRDSAHAALRQLFPEQYAGVASRTGFVWPAEADDTNDDRCMEALMALEVPNYVRSKLRQCVVPGHPASRTFNVTDPDLLDMIIAHYEEYREIIQRSVFPTELNQQKGIHHEILA